jgi:periplasmic divalent cation tolerance protein
MEFHHLWVYMTAENQEEADHISAALIQDNLAACTNIVTGMQSLFFWEGEVQKEKEVVLIAKTHVDCFEALKAKVKSIHSYEVPCIVAMPMLYGNEDFLGWISDETKHKQRSNG